VFAVHDEKIDWVRDGGIDDGQTERELFGKVEGERDRGIGDNEEE
jgi:hypothetical protein